MQFYSYYKQANTKEVESLSQDSSFCLLSTVSPSGIPHLGIFNPLQIEGRFYLHMNRKDEQVADLKERPKALLSFLDFLSVIPSYWVDEHYAGAATAYYRYAEWECTVELFEEPPSMLPVLQMMMDRYQPEQKYDPLNPELPIYKASFASIVVLKLTPVSSRTKWKLGQNRPMEIRNRVMTELKLRARDNDIRAAEEMEKTLL